MSESVEVDGSIFTFPSGWELAKIDEWPEQKRLTRGPFNSKACDLVALSGSVLWIIEAKDYTYPGAKVPADLAETVGVKVFHSLAILHAVAQWGSGDHQQFSSRAVSCTDARLCLAVELRDGGRKLIAVQTPLAALRDKLRKVTKMLNVSHPVVSNSHCPNGVPWKVSRIASTRRAHTDR